MISTRRYSTRDELTGRRTTDHRCTPTGWNVGTDPVRPRVEVVSILVEATIEETRPLKEAGAAAVVVGTALYEGRFTLREAQDAV